MIFIGYGIMRKECTNNTQVANKLDSDTKDTVPIHTYICKYKPFEYG